MAKLVRRARDRREADRRPRTRRASGPGPWAEALEARRLLTVAINEFGGSATVQSPEGITTGPDGNLWFTQFNFSQGSIGRITPTGTITTFNLPDTDTAPAGITTGPDGALWFTDPNTFRSLSFTDHIGRITTSGQITEYSVGNTLGAGVDQITAGPDDALWFTETNANQIGRIDTSGNVTEYTIPTLNSEPTCITLGPDGALWFTESHAGQIGRIDTQGNITEFSLGDNGQSGPTGIVTGPDGNLWFTEQESNQIGRITPQGVVTQFSTGITANSAPTAIVADGPDLAFTEQITSNIGLITTAGVITESNLANIPPTAGLSGITLGPDNNLWVAESTANQIARVIPLADEAIRYPLDSSIDAGSGVHGIATNPELSDDVFFTENGAYASGSSKVSEIGELRSDGTIVQFSQGITAGADPLAITFGPDGNYWFTEPGTYSIGRITTAGVVTRFEVPFPSLGTPTPFGITAGPAADDDLWFTDPGVGAIGRITTAGVITEFTDGLPINNTGTTVGDQVAGITLGPDGNLWFTDTGDSLIGYISPANGHITTFSIPNGGDPTDIATGPDGALYFTEPSAGKIGRITTAGAITILPTTGTLDEPGGITLGPDGFLYFVESGNTGNSVDRLALDGTVTRFPIPTADSNPVALVSDGDGNLDFTESFFNQSSQDGQIGQLILPQTSVSLTDDFAPPGLPGQPTSFTLSFEDNSSRAIVNNFASTVDYGDGTVVAIPPAGHSDSFDQPTNFTVEGSHVYAKAGQYTITVTIYNQAGQASPFTIPVTIGTPGITLPYVVTNTDDSGPGSLRQAILDANQSSGQTISFAIPSDLADPSTGVFSIALASPLPAIVTPTTIDGTTESTFIGQPASKVVVQVDGSVESPGSEGIVLGPGSGGSKLLGLSIFGFAATQVVVSSFGDVVSGCYIGFPAGSSSSTISAAALPNQAADPGSDGILIDSPNATIGGTAEGSGNVVSGNLGNGIEFSGQLAFGGMVLGNIVGLDPTGAFAMPNLIDGIVIDDGAKDVIVGQGNVVSGNSGVGVELLSTSQDLVVGTLVGTDRTGSTALGNGGAGISLDNGSSNNTIGGASATLANLVSGNKQAGILIQTGSAGNMVLGNRVGTDVGGMAAIPNQVGGIFLAEVTGNMIGPGNLVSGNLGIGVELFGATANTIAGNDIGLNAAGNAALGNTGSGICLDYGSSNNTIGGVAANAPNAISGNQVHGLVIQTGSDDNMVLGNVVGLDPAGAFAVPNQGDGIVVVGVSGEIIGQGNVVSGNLEVGIELFTTSGDLVLGCLIGTDATGSKALGNGDAGISLDGGSSNNTIGGTSVIPANLISGNKGSGILIETGSNANMVLGNRIGTNMLASAAVPNQVGGIFLLSTAGNMIGPDNQVSGNVGDGIDLLNSTGNTVAGNDVGLDAPGSSALGNTGSGIRLDQGSSHNTIGGLVGGQNVISGNQQDGLGIGDGSDDNAVQQERIGTNRDGTAAVPNLQDGVDINGSAGNTIGGSALASNVISGNGVVGLRILGGGSGNVIQANVIGTDIVGSRAIGNGSAGILITDSPANIVGPSNLVSGNGSTSEGAGIWIEGAGSTGNQVFGNDVGTDLFGKLKIPNTSIGLLINDAANNTVGGATPARSNLISGNSLIGLVISGAGSTGNVVQGNLIGTDVTGGQKLGNGSPTQGDGLYILNAADNVIGGLAPAEGNVISGNELDGVELYGSGSTGNYLGFNRIGLDGLGTGALGNGQDGVVLDGTTLNELASNYISANARNGVFISASSGTVLRLNAIGLGVGGEPLGNGTYGILIANGSPGTVDSGNLNVNNGLGSVRDTDVAPVAATPSKTVSSSGAKHVAKIQPKAQSFGSRALAKSQAPARAASKP